MKKLMKRANQYMSKQAIKMQSALSNNKGEGGPKSVPCNIFSRYEDTVR